MSRPAREQLPDEVERARAEAEAAVSEVMAREHAKSTRLTGSARRRGPSWFGPRVQVLMLLGVAWLYLCTMRPAWIVLPIPANEQMYGYYGQAWRVAQQMRRERLAEQRLHPHVLLPPPRAHVRAWREPLAFTAGESVPVSIAKTIARGALALDAGVR